MLAGASQRLEDEVQESSRKGGNCAIKAERGCECVDMILMFHLGRKIRGSG
jgi:hypothetical protein